MGVRRSLQALKLNVYELLTLEGRLYYLCVDKHTSYLCDCQLPADVGGWFLSNGC